MNFRTAGARVALVLVFAGVQSMAVADDTQGTQETSQLDDVVVTARRVAENQQLVPVAVTAFDSAQLQRLSVQNATDLSGRSPNVQIAQTGAGTGAMQVFIRGIGNDSLGFNLESPVGVYLDDVYLGRIQGALLDATDFERIEILRGPQGTLYGRNSTVGAVKYVTKEPDLNQEHFNADASFGNYSRFDSDFGASIPIIPGTLAAKVDIGTRSETGYLQGVDATGKPTGQTADGINRQSARVSVLWLPGGDWRINVNTDYSVDKSGSSQGTPLTAANGSGSCNSAKSPCTTLFGSPYKVGINNANDGRNKASGISLHADNTMDWGSFKSITSYRRLNNFDAVDVTAIPNVAAGDLPDTKKQSQESQEFQIASKQDQSLTWLAGLFYFREDIYHYADFVAIQLNDDHQVSNSYAAFADATYRVLDNLHVNLGGRFSEDEKHIDRAVLPVAGGAATLSGSDSFSTSKGTYKAGTDYEFTPDVMAYVTYSTGYRPGSFASTYAYPAVPAVLFGHTGTETAANIEVGMKSEWLEKRLRLNVSGFHTKYDNLQQQSSSFPYPITTYNINLKGIELETQARLFDPLTLYGNLGLLDSRIASGPQTGERPRLTPKVEYTVGGEYKADVRDGIKFFAGANIVHTSQFTTDDSNIPSVTQDQYTLLGAQTGFEFGEGGRYRVSVAGKNLTNKTYFVATVPDAEKFFGPPRMVYGSIAARF